MELCDKAQNEVQWLGVNVSEPSVPIKDTEFLE